MAYARAKMGRYVDRVRTVLLQQPFGDEHTDTETHALDSPTVSISKRFIRQSVNDAIRAIVPLVKACHVPGAIRNGTTLVPTHPVVRLLKNRTRREGVRAVYRTATRSDRLEETGKAGTASEPTYTFDDGEIKVFPAGNVSYYYVSIPDEVTTDDAEIALDERFEAAIVWYAAALCFERQQKAVMQEACMQRFYAEIDVFMLDKRLGPLNDSEMDFEG